MACRIAPRVGTCGATTGCLCPLAPSRTGERLGEKKAQRQMDGAFLDWALAPFSGYIAAAELSEGPSCVRSVVDQRPDKRMRYAVRDHDPPPADITAFVGRLQSAWAERGLALQGITTDGSPLYPEPIRTVFGAVSHQICPFHILKELTQGLLQAVAAERRRLATSHKVAARSTVAQSQRPAAWPARGCKSRSVPYSRGASSWSNVISSPASARGCGTSPAACPSDARCVPSWSTSLRCLIGGVACKPRWTSSRSCGNGSGGFHGLVTP